MKKLTQHHRLIELTPAKRFRMVTLICFILGCMLVPIGCSDDDNIIPPPVGSIKGTIRDFTSGLAIESAKISIAPGNIEVYSNSDGIFQIPDLKPAAYQIIASNEGYHSKNETVRVAGDSVTIVNFHLEPVQVEDPLPMTQVLYKLYGLNFSPYVDGQDPNNLVQISEAQIRERLQIIQPYTQWIRCFGLTHGLENIPRIAKEMGMRVAAGAWLDQNSRTNDEEISNLIKKCNDGLVDIAIIGSETLLRKDLTPEQLISYINEVRAQIPDTVIVSTADVYGEFTAELIDEIDIVMGNFYSYFEGVSIACAMYTLNENYQQLVDKSKGKPVYVSETGWPSAGDPEGDAIPSEENASYYFLNFVSWARDKNVPYFYFVGLDEIWKKRYEGEVGAHWGIFEKDGNMKEGMQRVFDDETIENNWKISEPSGGPGSPSIEFTFVPELGTFDNLKGVVRHVVPGFHLAVYIYVAGWYTKPTYSKPITKINLCADGSWTCDVTTGGADHLATQYSVFLLPSSFDPPLLRRSPEFPEELIRKAVARIDTIRSQ